MQRIVLERVNVDRRRGLTEVTVFVAMPDGSVSHGRARSGRLDGSMEASAWATLAALGDRVPHVDAVTVSELSAGDVQVVHVELALGEGEPIEGSCSELARIPEEAVARAVLDALNPGWGT